MGHDITLASFRWRRYPLKWGGIFIKLYRHGTLAKEECQHVQIRCRVDACELPELIPLSSQTRHNVMMTVKEALHNVIKHARAS